MTVLAIQHIVSDPDKHNGKPRIAGKGITVQHIAALHNLGWSVEQMVQEYALEFGEVYAALSYYFDHKSEIDRALAEAQQHAEQVGITFAAWKHDIGMRQD
ncbi:MAG: DUF433 domain-containing protein [Chloroflexi bacterium CFX4]|nr:DUF433 domain-containing protein [Chloroflexi bacterium CFX4]MDL1923532.1 DUF433 domain-containing protein [Chloroflexi bacterium CFX3]